MKSSNDILHAALGMKIAIPAFNIAHLPMTEPITRAVADQDSFALIEVSRIDWMKFGAKSPAAVIQEFAKWANPAHVRIHLDHVPVIDEDGEQVDYRGIIEEAINIGYQSVMVDASRLPFDQNVTATRVIAEMSHRAGIACESELGAVLGHEAGPLPPYDEMFASGLGFTRIDEASRFVRKSECDWLSVAIGNIHGAVSDALRDQVKVQARLSLAHLDRLALATRIPLVLHGGSGIKQEDVLAAMKSSIAKINVGTELRQAYETELKATKIVAYAQTAVYDRTASLIRDWFKLSGICKALRE